MPRLIQQQLKTHLWGAANILRGLTAGQDNTSNGQDWHILKRLEFPREE
jgi:hypothetical protein